MTPPLRGGLVGFGNVAERAHVPLWERDHRFRVVAVVEPDPARARLARDRLPDVPVFADLEALFASGPELDFADICTPPRFHAGQVAAACGWGLHVFCEKPLVTSMADLGPIRGAAARTDRVVFTVNNWKHAPLWAKALELVRAGAVGEPKRVDLEVLRTPRSGGGASDWRRSAVTAGGGILLDHGWHHLYLVLALLGRDPRSVSARMEYTDAGGPALEETVDLTLAFSEAQARLHLTWRAPTRRNRGVVEGTRGTLSLLDDHLVLEARDGSPPARFDFPEALSAGSHHLEWMAPVVEEFYREVREPGARGGNLREAERCLRLIHLGYRSAREGGRPLALKEAG